LRERMVVAEEPRYSVEYLDPAKRSIANSVQVFFADGTFSKRVEVEYPLGHRRRRAEALPHLLAKAQTNLATCFSSSRVQQILDSDLNAVSVTAFMELISASD
jgi:2-methylcitrate dehydratase